MKNAIIVLLFFSCLVVFAGVSLALYIYFDRTSDPDPDPDEGQSPARNPLEGRYDMNPDTILPGWDHKTLDRVSTPTECANLCDSETSFNCVSFEHNESKRQCVLSAGANTYFGTSLVPSDGTHYFKLVDLDPQMVEFNGFKRINDKRPMKGIVSVQTLYTNQECRNRTISTANATGYSWNGSTGTCTIYQHTNEPILVDAPGSLFYTYAERQVILENGNTTTFIENTNVDDVALAGDSGGYDDPSDYEYGDPAPIGGLTDSAQSAADDSTINNQDARSEPDNTPITPPGEAVTGTQLYTIDQDTLRSKMVEYWRQPIMLQFNAMRIDVTTLLYSDQEVFGDINITKQDGSVTHWYRIHTVDAAGNVLAVRTSSGYPRTWME